MQEGAVHTQMNCTLLLYYDIYLFLSCILFHFNNLPLTLPHLTRFHFHFVTIHRHFRLQNVTIHKHVYFSWCNTHNTQQHFLCNNLADIINVRPAYKKRAAFILFV